MSGRFTFAEPIVRVGETPPPKQTIHGNRDSDGLVQKNTKEQSELAVYARKPYHANGHGFPQMGWIRISCQDVQEAEEMHRNNPYIRIPIQINLNAILGGGIKFEGAAASSSSTEKKEWSSLIWLNFIADVLRCCWLYGFAVWTWVPQPGAGAIPCVVPLRKLEIMFKLNLIGEPMWAIRVAEDVPDVFSMDSQTKGPILRNFFVYTWQTPSADGRLNSEVLSLRQQTQYLDQLKRCAVIAEIGKCRPAVITEAMETKQDVKLSGVFTKESDLQEEFTDDALAHFANAKSRLANTMSRDDYVNLTNEIRYMFHQQFGDHLGPRVDLPKQRKLARYPLPQAPDHIRELMLLAQQNALMVFGIPPAMIQAESSKGKINLDMNAQAMYAHHLRNLKQKVLAMAMGVYNIIYGGQHMAEYLLQIPITEAADLDKARKATSVVISMPGIPPENVIRDLYMEGTLKYEAYREYLAANYSIPIDHLESKPKLSIKDLLTGGKTDKPTAGPKKKAKSTSEPKAKRQRVTKTS